MNEPIYFGEDETEVDAVEPIFYDVLLVAQLTELLDEFFSEHETPLDDPENLTLVDFVIWLRYRAHEMVKELDLEDDLPE